MAGVFYCADYSVSFLTLQRGNAVHDALRRQEDAERPERHANAEHWHDSRDFSGLITEC
nr:DUF1534 domain-containing protein [Pseudomonas congelans]